MGDSSKWTVGLNMGEVEEHAVKSVRGNSRLGGRAGLKVPGKNLTENVVNRKGGEKPRRARKGKTRRFCWIWECT